MPGIAVVSVTGRRLSDLRAVAGDLRCADAVIAENGAVFSVPGSGHSTAFGLPPPPHFLEALKQRSIPFAQGECIVDTDARFAEPILQVIRDLELPFVLAFNRGQLMVLPQGISKATGLRDGLAMLRLSLYNTLGIGDAEPRSRTRRWPGREQRGASRRGSSRRLEGAVPRPQTRTSPPQAHRPSRP